MKMKKTLLFLLFWFFLVNIFALLVLNRFNLTSDTAYLWIEHLKTTQKQSWNPISLHARWDSFAYLGVATHGYRLKQDNPCANIVFFPLYPFLLHSVAPLTRGNYIFAGWILSTLFLFGAVCVFYNLLQEFHPSLDPETPIFYLLIFPTAFFLNAVYTESLFLFLSLLTFYYALKGRFGVAGVFGFLAALTRVTGVLLFVPVVWEYCKRHGIRGMLKPSFLPVFFIPLGTISFFLYHYVAFGDAFLFLKVESAWGRTFLFNRNHFSLFSPPAVVNFFLDIIFVGCALVSAYLVFKRAWVSYGLYILATLAVALSTGTLISVGRYILVLFPIYIALATVKSRHFEKVYTAASLLLFALHIILFVTGYWAG